MITIWQNLSINIQRLFITICILTGIVLIGMQFHVNSQGSMSDTYPKGFRVVPARSNQIRCWSGILLISFLSIT